MIWPFKRREAKHQPPAKFPEPYNYAEWMREQVAYYRKAFHKEAWHLFSPYQGAYLPLFCACGFTWNDEVQAEYRKVKDENLDLVALAIKNRPEHYANVISRVGDLQDYNLNIRLYS